MENNDLTLFRAEFNPIIKPYIFIYVLGILLVSIIGIPLILVWFFIGKWYSDHYFAKLECELTERTLRFKKGIIFQIEKTIPLENIQDLTFIEGPLLKYFNLCVLKVETAGQSMQKGNEMKLIGIKEAEQFRTKVLNQRHLIQKKGHNASEQLLSEIKSILERMESNFTQK